MGRTVLGVNRRDGRPICGRGADPGQWKEARVHRNGCHVVLPDEVGQPAASAEVRKRQNVANVAASGEPNDSNSVFDAVARFGTQRDDRAWNTVNDELSSELEDVLLNSAGERREVVDGEQNVLAQFGSASSVLVFCTPMRYLGLSKPVDLNTCTSRHMRFFACTSTVGTLRSFPRLTRPEVTAEM